MNEELLYLYRKDKTKVLLYNDLIFNGQNIKFDMRSNQENIIKFQPKNSYYRKIIYLLCDYYGLAIRETDKTCKFIKYIYLRNDECQVVYEKPTIIVKYSTMKSLNLRFYFMTFPLSKARKKHLFYGNNRLDYTKKYVGMCNMITHMLYQICQENKIIPDCRTVIYEYLFMV